MVGKKDRLEVTFNHFTIHESEGIQRNYEEIVSYQR